MSCLSSWQITTSHIDDCEKLMEMIVEGKVLTASLVLKKHPNASIVWWIHSITFGDCQGNLCFILIFRVFSRKEAQWTSLVGGSKQNQGWFSMVCWFLYCCRSVKMFVPSFTLRKFLRDVISTPEFFLDYFALLTNLSSGGVTRVYTKMCFLGVVLTIISFR